MLPFLFALSTAQADNHILPELIEDASEISAQWTNSNGWSTSPIRTFEVGSRFGLLINTARTTVPTIEVRTQDEHGAWSGWLPTQDKWHNSEFHVVIADLPFDATDAQMRISDLTDIHSIAWEILEPVNEPRRPQNAPPPPNNTSLSSGLLDLGVVPRTSWGASSTQCTSPENNWYRNAIHHTAGTQTYGGTVLGQVQATQAYAMNSGNYCDIPYQFMVGYDGSLWEGRQLIYRSGATGGYDNGIQNNVGNIAVSFMGCYDPSACTVGPHFATPVMFGAARLLLKTLGAENNYSINSSTVKGHQQWPGNYTACPGSDVLASLDVIRSPDFPVEGQVVATSYSNGTVTAAPNEVVSIWVDVLNTGYGGWAPDWTNLGILPRDVDSVYEVSSWYNTHRVATVPSHTSPGDTARFSFEIQAPSSGTHSVSLEMVTEWYSWFSDYPVGNGPQPSDISFTLVVEQPSQPSSEPASEPAAEPAVEPSIEPSSEPASEPSNETTVDEECIDREDGVWCLSNSILGSCIDGQFNETSCVDMGRVCSLELDRCIDIQCADRETSTWCYENNVQACWEGNWSETVCGTNETCSESGICLSQDSSDSGSEGVNGTSNDKDTGCSSTAQHPNLAWLLAVGLIYIRRRTIEQ